MSSVDRSQLLAAKSAEIEKELEAWAIAEKILRPREKITCSIGISVDDSLLGISKASRLAYNGTIIRPVILSQEEIDIILSRLKGKSLKDIFKWFVRNIDESGSGEIRFGRNKPINDCLRAAAVNGKFYHLFAVPSLKPYCPRAQIWEVEPAKDS